VKLFSESNKTYKCDLKDEENLETDPIPKDIELRGMLAEMNLSKVYEKL
jgi:hypothetical protein